MNIWEKIKPVVLWIFVILLCVQGCYNFFEWKADHTRQTNNLKAINQPAETFITRDDHQASKKLVQYITPDELKDVFPEVKTKLSNLYIKPNRTENYTETKQTMNINIKAPVTIKPIQPKLDPTLLNCDTSALKQLKPMEARVMDFTDQWISIYAELGPDTGNIQVAAVDSIFTAIYKGARRHPMLWILSKRQLEVAASNRNPYIKIEVIQGGLIKK